MKRQFLQLAHTYTDQFVTGWYWSVKLDGMRCFWDGGISRGILKSNIPWANTDKDHRYLNPPVATGLWSRLGNVIHAPDWWLDTLPKVPLDGELLIPGALHQESFSVIKDIVPSEKWRGVKYCVFDLPPLACIFASGVIDTPGFFKLMVPEKCLALAAGAEQNKEYKYWQVRELLPRFCNQTVLLVEQHQLPYSTKAANLEIQSQLAKMTSLGEEGIMLRNPEATYCCGRTHNLLKMKHLDDAEGTVIGYTTGRIGKEGKLLGLMGNAMLRLDDGNILELSGFTDAERELEPAEARDWAINNPDKVCPDWISAKHFPRGTRVSFQYRGLTRDGIPNEARYWRKNESL